MKDSEEVSKMEEKKPTTFDTFCPVCEDIRTFKRIGHQQAVCQDCGVCFDYNILRKNHDIRMFKDRRRKSRLN